MLTKENKQRVNIMLDEEQRSYLNKLAQERGSSMSEIIREMIEETRRRNQARKLAKAAEALAGLYRQDTELTAFTALDGEDIS